MVNCKLAGSAMFLSTMFLPTSESPATLRRGAASIGRDELEAHLSGGRVDAGESEGPGVASGRSAVIGDPQDRLAGLHAAAGDRAEELAAVAGVAEGHVPVGVHPPRGAGELAHAVGAARHHGARPHMSGAHVAAAAAVVRIRELVHPVVHHPHYYPGAPGDTPPIENIEIGPGHPAVGTVIGQMPLVVK